MAGNGTFLGFQLPFGASNVSNPTTQPNNPNFPSKNALDVKNPGADPKTVQGTGAPDVNTDPSNNPDPNKGTKGSQLDEFKDMFTLPVDDKGNVISHTNPLAEPLLTVDPVKLQAAAKKMNFAQGINQESVTKALAGDVQAFMEVLNTVAQNGFATAMQANAGVVETAFGRHTERFERALPDRIRSTQIDQAQVKHPALSHPAAAPMVAALKTQIASTNPHLPPDRVAEMAERYVIAMATDINSHDTQQTAATNKGTKGEVDWNQLLTGTAS